MNWCALAVCLAGLAAAGEAADSSGPDQDSTYIIRLTNGQVIHGFIRDEDKGQGVLVVEGDEPLSSGFRRTRRIRTNTVEDRARERRPQRQERIDRTLDEAGYVRVGELSESWTWVSKREYALAERARERAAAMERARIAAEQAAGGADATPVAPDDADPEATAEAMQAVDANGADDAADAPGGWRRLAAAGGIALVGLIAAGFVIRRLVL